MNLEDIKVGETYNVRVRVGRIDTNRFVCQPLNQDGTPSDFCPNYFNFAEAEAFSPLSTENGIKNTEPAPKYDPRRKFRKGDKVRVVEEINGRIPPLCGDIEAGNFYTVSDNEDSGNVMLEVNGKFDCIDWYWLELVTPVEEQEPYSVHEYEKGYEVQRGALTFSVFYKAKYGVNAAKAAAEAERDRLNAEYRKEQG